MSASVPFRLLHAILCGFFTLSGVACISQGEWKKLWEKDAETKQGQGAATPATEHATEEPPDCDLASLPHAESLPSVAVLDFQVSDDLKRSIGESLADLCRDTVLESGRFILIERESIKAILAEEDFAATFKCDDTKCLVDYGKKLSAQKIIHGRVNKIGESFLISIKVLDVGSAAVEGLKTTKVTGGLERALDFVQPVTCQILRSALAAEQ